MFGKDNVLIKDFTPVPEGFSPLEDSPTCLVSCDLYEIDYWPNPETPVCRIDLRLVGCEKIKSECQRGMDVVFAIDYTGSMGGSINDIKASVISITDKIIAKSNNNYRLGLVIFDEDTSPPAYINKTAYTGLPASQKYTNTTNQYITALEKMSVNNRLAFINKLNLLNTVLFPLGSGMGSAEPSDMAVELVATNNIPGYGYLAGVFGVCDSSSSSSSSSSSTISSPCQEPVKLIILITDNPPSGNDDRYTLDDIIFVNNLIPQLSNQDIKVILMTTAPKNVLYDLAIDTDGMIIQNFSPSSIIEAIEKVCGTNPPFPPPPPCECQWIIERAESPVTPSCSPDITILSDQFGVRVAFQDSVNCGGSCNQVQTAKLSTNFYVSQNGVQLTANAFGSIEAQDPGFEALQVSVDGINLINLMSMNSNKECEMEDRSDSNSITLPVGCHKIEIFTSTVDARWHKNAYWQVTFTTSGDGAPECIGPGITPTPTPTPTLTPTPNSTGITPTPTPTLTPTPNSTGITPTPTPTLTPTPTPTPQSCILFDKNSWSSQISDATIKSAVDDAADFWNNLFCLDPQVVQFVKTNIPGWNGITLDSITFRFDNDNWLASCGPTTIADILDADNVKHNTISFLLNVNTRYIGTVSQVDWKWIFIHELAHGLGIGTIWNRVTNFWLGRSKYPLTGSAYNNIIGDISNNRTLIPLEDAGGAGTAGGHWEDDARTASYPGSDGFAYPGIDDIMNGSITLNQPESSRIAKVTNITLGNITDMGYIPKSPFITVANINKINKLDISPENEADVFRFGENCSKYIDHNINHKYILNKNNNTFIITDNSSSSSSNES